MSEPSRDQQVQAILYAYLQAVDAGDKPDPDDIVRQHPELAEELRAFFADQENLNRLAQSLRQGHALAGELTLASGDNVEADAASSGAAEARTRIRYFGDYELHEEIARGGMGVVFKAKQVSLNRPVALKMILRGELASEAEVQRFRAEAEAAANLDHPNIVPIYEIGAHEGQQYFSMKLIGPGQRRADLGVAETVRLMILIARAVHHAHQRGILHRDLKPGNILWDENGDPHVADFGLAKRVDTDSGMTRSGAIVGTPNYMAPEQARAEKVLTTAVDIYSLGAILFAWLTGRPPFRGDDVLATLAMVVHDEPPRPRTLQPDIDHDLETICLKCLHKDPAKRYASAADLADDLRRYEAGEPVVARPVGRVERTTMWMKRRPVIAGLIALSALLAVGGLVGVTAGLGWALIERDHALSQENKAKNEKKSADDERKKAEKLAGENKLLAIAAEERREKAEELALQVSFNHYYSRASANPALALVGTAQMLPKAAELKNPRWLESMQRHLGGWAPEVHHLRWIGAHGNAVTRVVVSADGKTTITGSVDKTARLWETATGKPIGAPLVHQGEVVALALSADGKIALTGSADKTAQVWETATGKPIGPLLQHQDPVMAVALSADGQTALTGSTEIFKESRDKSARLWATATGKPIGAPLQHKASVAAVALSADGKVALTGSFDNTARLWDAVTGKPLGAPLEHQDPVLGVALTQDGKTALTMSPGQTRLWQAATGKMIGPLQHQGMVTAAAFSADGKYAMTGSYDRLARLWQTATGALVGEVQHRGPVVAVALNANGSVALCGYSDVGQLWDMTRSEPLGPPLYHQDMVFAVALSGDGKTAVTASADKTARCWKMAAGKPSERRLEVAAAGKATEKRFSGAALSADGKTALTLTDAGARLWDAVTGKPIGALIQLPDQDRITCVALRSDGKIALTGSPDKARLFETTTGKSIGPALHHDDWIDAVALSADGKTALTGSRDKSARLWDTATGKPIGAPLRHQAPVDGVALSADGKIALTGCSDRSAQLWETDTGKPIDVPIQLQHPVDPADRFPIYPVALSADGKTALTGSGQAARAWDMATRKPIGPPLQHQGPIVAVALSADGRTALTGSRDRTARLWETATGKPIGTPLQHPGEVFSVALSADGKTALTRTTMSAHVWHVGPLVCDLQRTVTWAQVVTGLEADEEGNARALSADAWQQRRQRLQELGGPPLMD